MSTFVLETVVWSVVASDMYFAVRSWSLGVGDEGESVWSVDSVCDTVYVCDAVAATENYTLSVCVYGSDGAYSIDGVCSACHVCKESGVDVTAGVPRGILCYEGTSVGEVGVDHAVPGFRGLIVSGCGMLADSDSP